MKLRLRNGQARAEEALAEATGRADDAERRLEETRRQASLAAETGAARIDALEAEVERGRDAFVEIKRLERIIEGEGSTGAKRLLAAELEDVKRNAALAAEKGGARIRDAEAELERVRAELARMAAERTTAHNSSGGQQPSDDGERRADAIAAELEDVKRRADLAATNGRARIDALERELEETKKRAGARGDAASNDAAASSRVSALENELRDVKRRAALAAEEGGARIRAAEAELARMRRAVDAANAARAAGGDASREFELQMRDKQKELDAMRADLRDARETARANAALAVEAASRLKRAEKVVQRARAAAEDATARARRSEKGAAAARGEAAAASRAREDAVRAELADAERRYASLRDEASRASAEAAAATADRDARIEALEVSLGDLERKARDAVRTAETAVSSAEAAREGAESAAARAAADAAVAYSRLEGSLSRAEEEIEAMELQTLADLRDVSSHRHHGSSLQYYNAAVSAGVVPSVKGAALAGVVRAETRTAEICRLSQTLARALADAGETPAAPAPTPPPRASEGLDADSPEVGQALRDAEATADVFEEVAAALWAQAESVGIDPAAAISAGQTGSEMTKQ